MRRSGVGTLSLSMIALGLAGAPAGSRAGTSTSFVNFETPQVHPMEMTPDGQTLLVCNTADHRIELYSLAFGYPTWSGYVSVGVDPVTVRARNNGEAWVVNRVSDSVSIVDLATKAVTRTIFTQDEPADVVFAGSPTRAFVTCSGTNKVMVFDPANLGGAPSTISIDAQRPRALSVSPDGSKVYAAIFESGNGTTVLAGGVDTTQVHGLISFPPNAVSDPAGPYGGVNPPPNAGVDFNPPIAAGNENPPKVSLIVRKNAAGQWFDDNAHDWTSLVSGANAPLSGRPVGWDLPDRDVAVIDTTNFSVTYATGLMNLCMAVGVNPSTGAITVVGTDATNHIRYEPNVRGTFLRVEMASVDASNLSNKTIVDLNPHLDYLTPSIAQSERNKSVGDPRAVVWNSSGTKGYVAGMGSNNVIVVNPAGGRAGLTPTIDVGEGPTGLVLDETNDAIYVLNRFSASISVVSMSAETVIGTVSFFDPTPAEIKAGRRHLYDTHLHSGLGQAACASCHVDARIDRLGWDLGDPAGSWVSITNANKGFGVPLLEPVTTDPPFQPYHPMKGPMVTQTLQDIIGHEPLHWRGDRGSIEDFAAAFLTLQGADGNLSATEMAEFKAFLATIAYGPNPFRMLDNTLPQDLPEPGHYKTGRYGPNAGDPMGNGNGFNGIGYFRNRTRKVDGGRFACVTCHTLPTGAGPDMTWNGSQYVAVATGANGEHHLGSVTVAGVTNITMKVPHLRNLYNKVGMDLFHTSSSAGFGYAHDGTIDSIERFINMPEFQLNSDQETADGVAFLLSFSGSQLPTTSGTIMLEPPGTTSLDVPASVGTQMTLTAAPTGGESTTLNALYGFANAGKIGMIAKGLVAGEQRGYTYFGSDLWQSDRVGEHINGAQLLALASPAQPITITAVPKFTEVRLGIDRNENGCYDGDEQITCSCLSDFNHDGFVTGEDFDQFVDLFYIGDIGADIDGNTFVNGDDFDLYVSRFELGC